MTDNAAASKRNWIAPSLVVLMFVLPIVVAWWYSSQSTLEDGRALSNRGILIRPPLDLREHAALTPLAGIPLAPGEWAVVHFTDGPCDATCESGIARAQAVYKVLGHDGTRVRLVALGAPPKTNVPVVRILDDLAAARNLADLLRAKVGDLPRSASVLLDWRGQIMMLYNGEHGPADLKKDLKRLLRGSKIR